MVTQSVNYNTAQYAADFEQARLNKWLMSHPNDHREEPTQTISGADEKCIEVNLSALPKEKRRPVWDWLQANQPELAKMLGEDRTFLDIKAAFNCSVKVELPTSACKQLGLIR